MRLSETIRGLLTVTPEEKQVADMALRLGCYDLKLEPAPRLNWFPLRATRPRLVGYCSKNGKDIFIRTGLTATDLLETILHELKHAQQERSVRTRRLSRSNLERDAKLFSELEWPKVPRDISHRDLFKLLASAVTAISPPRWVSNKRTKITIVHYCHICNGELPRGEQWICAKCEKT